MSSHKCRKISSAYRCTWVLFCLKEKIRQLSKDKVTKILAECSVAFDKKFISRTRELQFHGLRRMGVTDETLVRKFYWILLRLMVALLDQSWGFTSRSTARVILGQVLRIATCGTRTHRGDSL